VVHDLLSGGIFVIYAKQQPYIKGQKGASICLFFFKFRVVLPRLRVREGLWVVLLREKQSKREILEREDVLGVE